MEIRVRKGFADGYCMLLFETVFSPLFVAECHCSLSGPRGAFCVVRDAFCENDSPLGTAQGGHVWASGGL